MKRKSLVDFIVALGIALIFSLLHLSNFYVKSENRLYDLLLHIKPGIEESPQITLLDIDDLAIAKIGLYPWSRDILADGLITMKEFGTSYAVFDIEFVEESPMAVNSRVLREDIPDLFTEEFAIINENVNALFSAISAGSLSLRDAKDYIADLKGLTDKSKGAMLDKVEAIAKNNDLYFGQAARFFENAFYTVNMLPQEDPDVPQERKTYTLENVSLNTVTARGEQLAEAVDIRPAILPILTQAKGAGFPNIIVDEDGVRRRLNLIYKYKGKYFPQLAVSALLDWMGNPQIEVRKDRILLSGAVLPDGTKTDISIPLTEKGEMLINWPKKKFEESFAPHLSYYYLVLHKRQEDALLENMKIMEQAGYFSYDKADVPLMDAYRYADGIKQDVMEGGDLGDIEEWRSVRDYFFTEVGTFLSEDTENRIYADFDAILTSPDISDDEKAQYKSLRDEVGVVYSASRDIYTSLMKTRSILSKELKNTFCIIGWTGTSTTDVGVNPFDSKYDNVGTHASVVNTILNRSFLDDSPSWYAIIGTILFTLIMFLIIFKLEPLATILVGIGFTILILGGSVAFFILAKRYLPIMSPLISIFLTFLFMTVMKFVRTAKEKSFIRNAFGHYLSGDVINQLLLDPEKLNLGGEKKTLTACFTDVKGFSTISEVLDPTDLVTLLNRYLTTMSDIVLAQKGTIDKYEGDAIIAFYGAPLELPDHTKRGCAAALLMKKAEGELNKVLLEEKVTPNPLLTRIGLNSGEMVVGNMGTAQKMDYTIMGNAVNLAARLEGVNKQYGTWILMSETTYESGGNEFVTRGLDRVRVVGIHKPVRLYELVEFKEKLTADMEEVLALFHKGLSLFEQKDWDGGATAFEKALKINPEDGPSSIFLKRCQEYKVKPPPEGWDGVFNLTSK